MPGMRQWFQGCITAIAVVLCARSAMAVPGCPFCGPSNPPYAKRIAECDVAVLTTWNSSVTDQKGMTAKTIFEVAWTLKKGDKEFKKGDKITYGLDRNGRPNDPFILLGTTDDTGELKWDPIDVRGEYLLSYILKVPAPETTDRLAFFLKFLEFPDTDVANDAYAEFSRAQFADVAALAPRLPRKKLREWLASDLPAMQVRLGLYGMMLGLCGDAKDAEFLEQRVMTIPEPDKPRFGIDGMMAGYIMLTGERGLNKLLDSKFDDPRADSDLPLVTNALVFLWDYYRDRIPPEVIQAGMRRMLDHPKWGFGVLVNLARWKDWKTLDKVVAAYGKPPFETDLAKREIVKFALVCEKNGRTTSPDKLPESAINARKFLDGLDAKFVKSVERDLGGLPRPSADLKPASANP